MAARLKSILDRIHWSLLLKAVVFGAAWYFLPWWAFFLLALYFYLVPLFQPFKLALPFTLILFFAYFGPPSLGLAFVLGILFYLVLGIKDLIFIDRRGAYEFLLLLLVFLSALRFFAYFSAGYSNSAFFAALALAFVYFLLMRALVSYEPSDRLNRAVLRRNRIFAATSAFLVFDFALVLLALPLNFFYQAALFFAAAAVFTELASDHALGELRRLKLLWSFSVFFIILIIVLGAADWGL